MCGCNDKKDEKLEKKEGSCGCGCGCDEEKSVEKTSCCDDKDKSEKTKEPCCSDKNSCC